MVGEYTSACQKNEMLGEGHVSVLDKEGDCSGMYVSIQVSSSNKK